MDKTESDDEIKRISNHDGRGASEKVVCVGFGKLDAREYGVLPVGDEGTSEARECGNQSTDIFPARPTFGKACGKHGIKSENLSGGGQLSSCLPARRRKAGIVGVTRFRIKEG